MIENFAGRHAVRPIPQEPAATPGAEQKENVREANGMQSQDVAPSSDVSEESSAPNMVTINRDAAERFMLAIEQTLGDLTEQKEQVQALIAGRKVFEDTTIAKFNALADAMKTLSEKIEATGSYEAYLVEQVKNANLSADNALLKQQLQKEKAEISAFIMRTEEFLNEKIETMNTTVNQLKTNNDAIDACIDKLEKEIRGKVEKVIMDTDNKVNEASSSFMNGSKNQYESLKADSKELIEQYTAKCQEHLSIVQKQSIDFLKQCQKQNQALIEKVPGASNSKTKLSKKEAIVSFLTALLVTGFIAAFQAFQALMAATVPPVR